METSTKITYATLSSDELVGRARAATTFASIGGRAGAVILAFALNNFSIPGFFFGISLILSMACFYFSWNTYHLGLNFEELYRDFKVNWKDRIGVVSAFEENLPLQMGSLHASNQQHESSSDYADGRPGQFVVDSRILLDLSFLSSG